MYQQRAWSMSYQYLVLVLGLLLRLSRCDADVTWSASGNGLGDDGSGLSGSSSRSCLPLQSANCSSKLWKKANNGACVCGDRLNGIVSCMNNSERIGVLQCYCMYRNSTSKLVVGACFYGCYTHSKKSNLYQYYMSFDNLTHPCKRFNRTGQFCGKCDGSDKGISAYSFSLKCRPCVFSWRNIAKYIAIAYGPLTLFIVIIVVFTVSVNSAPLHGYIFVAQILAASVIARVLQGMIEVHTPNTTQNRLITFGATVYGFWNLDFFRFANHHFCLHPSLSTLDIMSLDYLIAVYPLIIIVIMYVMVESHGRGYRLLVLLWKPFSRFFSQFRHRLNIRTSLIDAFVTFFSLSYVKFLSTTTDLMASTPVWDKNGTLLHYRVYYNGTLPFFEEEHRKYAVISLICFILFNIFPIIFLLLYPRRFFQKVIPNKVRRILHPFMDALFGIYRDGTDGGWDCRFFVVVYLIAKISIFGTYLFSINSFNFVLITMITTVTAMMVAVLKPYKSSIYNTVDTILITLLALTYAGLSSFSFANSLSKQQLPFARFLAIFPIPLPFFYAFGLIFYKGWVLFKLSRRSLRSMQWIILCLGRVYLYLTEKMNRGHEMENFPSINERTQLIQHISRSLNH